jgi:DNA polymerase-3 subunit epsilon
MLGLDHGVLERLLDRVPPSPAPSQLTPSALDLAGTSVCFTGTLRSCYQGQLITRGRAEELARAAGLRVAKSVTRGLDVLVVADPNTLSTKARKARDLGVRILAEAAFWRAIGVQVE